MVTAKEEKVMIYENLFEYQISQTNHTSRLQDKTTKVQQKQYSGWSTKRKKSLLSNQNR